MPAGMGVNILTSSGKLLKHGESKSKVYQNLDCCSQNSFEYIEDQGNGQLAVFRYDLRRLTSLMSNTEYCFKDGKFLIHLSYIHFITCHSRIMTLKL